MAITRVFEQKKPVIQVQGRIKQLSVEKALELASCHPYVKLY